MKNRSKHLPAGAWHVPAALLAVILTACLWATQLGVFGLAAARLLPSANRINTYMTNISYFQPFLDNVSDNLQDEIHDRDISYRLEDYPASEQVEKLPVKEREVIVLFYWQDMSAEAIADSLGLSRSQVYRRLDRARRRLKLDMEGGSDSDD